MLTKCLTERGGRRLGTMCRFLRFRFVRACLLSVRGCVGLPRQAGPLSRQGTELVRAFSGHEVSAMPNDPADRQQTTRKVVAVSLVDPRGTALDSTRMIGLPDLAAVVA